MYLEAVKRSRGARPPASRLERELLSGIRGVQAPPSLRDQSAESLARYYNSNECLPPLGWFSFVECAVFVRLKPALFLNYLYARGEILKVKLDYSEAEFQLVLKKLYASYGDHVELPLRMRPLAACQIIDYLVHLRGADSIEHAFYSLGLKDKQEVQFRMALQAQQGSLESENACPDFNHRILRMYTRCPTALTSSRFVLPASKGLLELTSKFEPEGQNLFLRGSLLGDVRTRDPRSCLFWLEEFMTMNNFVKFCTVLYAAESARLKHRPHAALYLCLYLLFEFETDPENGRYKILIYKILVESLANFNCSYDTVTDVLRLMEKSLARESDYCLFVLAKQHFLAVSGFSDRENELFETCLKDKVFLVQSIYMTEFLSRHVKSELRRCENAVLEIWLAKREQKRGELEKEISELISRSKNSLVRLQEILCPLAESGPALPSATARLATKLLFRRRILLSVLLSVSGQGYLSRRWLLLAQDQIPPTFKQPVYESLLKAHEFYQEPILGWHFSDLEARLESFQKERDTRFDWKHSLRSADFNFEILTFLIGLNLHHNCPVIVRDLYHGAVTTYRNLSVLHKHPRLAVLEKLCRRVFFPEKKQTVKATLGTFEGQLKRNVENCELLSKLPGEKAGARQILSFHFRRDGRYLNSVAGFGYQSVVCCAGIC